MQLEEVAARIEIAELLVRYVRAADDGDAEAYAAVFTEDGVLEGSSGKMVGRAALAENISRFLAQTVHQVTNVVIEVDGDRATSSCLTVAHNRAPRGTERGAKLIARYDDELRRTPEGWRIAHRYVRYPYDAPGPTGGAAQDG